MIHCNNAVSLPPPPLLTAPIFSLIYAIRGYVDITHRNKVMVLAMGKVKHALHQEVTSRHVTNQHIVS